MSATTLKPLRRERQPADGCRTVGQGARGLTLDDLIVGVWEGLHADHSVACPVCGAAMMPRVRTGPRPVAGKCDSCRSILG
ncbi:MAG: hypothetical protein F2813_05405 [Actinobacteria bacterium]|uniref:Unannotated protein n=1 Tax=freshwater metagenome TaxID=449393 RepID=A0A6J5ZVH1_9ZZZZ|nr:hypothetical protein [Actinomycetota bacterium]